jgi:hypothetical protein
MYLSIVNVQPEIFQQPIYKKIGRPLSQSRRLAALGDMIAFVKKYARPALARREPEFFPIRKAVGRARSRGN